MTKAYRTEDESWEVERVTRDSIAIKHDMLKDGKSFMLSGVVSIPVDGARTIAEAILKESETWNESKVD